MAEIADRIRKGVAAYEDIAKSVERLESELLRSQRQGQTAHREHERVERLLMETVDAEPVLDDLEDMRRGTITPQEVYDKWLPQIPESVPWARAA